MIACSTALLATCVTACSTANPTDWLLPPTASVNSTAQIMFSVLCLKMRPPWPEGKCGALKPLYDMCCDPAPENRPNFDQVVTCLDSLWMRLETSRPE